MVVRVLYCPVCEKIGERMAVGMAEPSRKCADCGGAMDVKPSFPSGVKFIGPGFHCVDYPKSAAQLKKDYGLDKHDSTDPNSDYNQDGYKEEMAP